VSELRKSIDEVAARPEVEAAQIQVQHLLVAHKDAGVPGASRTIEEAETLTGELFARIQKGEDFDAMVKEHTNDSHPGIYTMDLEGPGDQAAKIYARGGMVPAFGNVGWKLKVGEVGVAPHDARASPYGFHIIKRLA